MLYYNLGPLVYAGVSLFHNSGNESCYISFDYDACKPSHFCLRGDIRIFLRDLELPSKRNYNGTNSASSLDKVDQRSRLPTAISLL